MNKRQNPFDIPDDVQITCLSVNCPERSGGKCDAIERNRLENINAESLNFLSESNKIENVTDGRSLFDACLAWDYLMGQEKLTKEVVLQTHKILMKNQKTLRDGDKGHYRTAAVWVGEHEKMKWYAVLYTMTEWLSQVDEAVRYCKDRAEVDAKDLHIAYENIHPFLDGNGRTGRMFMNWHRVKCGLPILVLWADEKYENYYNWFNGK